MQELIKVTKENGEQLVSARELHEFLESKQDFTTWIKSRIEKYGFVENEDFTLHKFMVGKSIAHDYILKIDMAKELSMVEGNEKGSQARRYFLNCEKKLKEIIQKPLSVEEMIINQAQSVIELKKEVLEIRNDVKSVINTVTIESNKQRKIQLEIANRVYKLLPEPQPDLSNDDIKIMTRKMFSGLHKDLRNKFLVSTYKDIKVIDYEEALEFIREWV